MISRHVSWPNCNIQYPIRFVQETIQGVADFLQNFLSDSFAAIREKAA